MPKHHLLNHDLSKLPHQRAGDLAYHIFCTPSLSERRSKDHEKLADRARYHLRIAKWSRLWSPAAELQVYTYEPDGASRGTIVVVHGWTSEASFMTALVEPMRRSGFRVVLFDFPAHGHSAGKRVDLIGCARAVLEVSEAFGPVHAVVAHSFAGLAVLLVAEGGPPMPRSVSYNKYVLIACPNRLQDVTRDFGRYHKLSEPAQVAYERHLERVGHRSVSEFNITNLMAVAPRPTLIIHSRDDTEIAFQNAIDITSACPSTELAEYDGLGHRAVLFAPQVVRRVMTYVTKP